MMGKTMKYCLVLLIVFVMSGCLWDPDDSQIKDTSWQPQTITVYWTQASMDITLQCLDPAANQWVDFAKGKTDVIPAGTSVTPLYMSKHDAVIPVNCWKAAPTGSPAAYQAQVRATIPTGLLPAFDDTGRNCMMTAIQTQGSSIDWWGAALNCSNGRRDVMVYAKNHNPYFVQASSWNYVFQPQYIDANLYQYRWTSGDGGAALELPYCDQCDASQKYRKFWLFGDSGYSAIDASGKRLDLSMVTFGQTIAITSHGATNTSLPIGSPIFDWGAQAQAYTYTNTTDGTHGPKISTDSWMPLLMDTTAQTLSNLHPLSVLTHGYNDSGYTNQNSIAQVYRSPWYKDSNLLPVRNPNLIPIYEYSYNHYYFSFHSYTTYKIPNGLGYVYERIAFWVFDPAKPQVAGTTALYQYLANDFSDARLSTNSTGINGYQRHELLGYVYPVSTTAVDTYPLWEYFSSSSTDHKYTTYPNDSGKQTLMWASGGVIIGNDLVFNFCPMGTSVNEQGKIELEASEKPVVAIVKGVNRPYVSGSTGWGKTQWVSPNQAADWDPTIQIPAQYVLEPCNARINWGAYRIKSPNYDTDKYIYVYGLRNFENEQSDFFQPFDIVLARVRCTTAEDYVNFANWRYYSNGSWVSDQESATAIATTPTNNFSIIKNPTKANRYLLVRPKSFSSPSVVSFYSASSLTEQFTTTAVSEFDLATYVNELPQGTYNVGLQSVYSDSGLSFGGNNNGLMISYRRDCKVDSDASCKKDASVGVPRFVNLPWSQIDP